MAKYENPAELDYRNGGDTVDDFAQKYMRTVDYIIKALNDLRTPTGNTAGVDPEPYMWRIADNKLYIRNADNTSYVLLGEISPNFGFRQSVNDRFLTTADLEGEGAVVTRNEAGKVEGDITGSPGKIANKTIDVTPTADNDVIAYDAAQQKWVKKTLNDYLKKQGDAGWDEMVDEVADQVINDITPIIFNFWYLDDDGYLVPLVGSTEGGMPSIHGMVGDYEQITARSVDVAGNLSATGNVTAGMITTPQANVTTLTANAVNAQSVIADDVIAKGPVVDVRAFGAVGDGVTDDTAAIQAACLAGNCIFIPAGTYVVSNTITINDNSVIRCDGWIVKKGHFDNVLILGNNVDVQINIDVQNPNSTNIYSNNACDIYAISKTGICVHDSAIKNSDSKAIMFFENCAKVKVTNNILDTYVYGGIVFSKACTNISVIGNTVLNGHGNEINRYPISLSLGTISANYKTKYCQCIGNYIEDTTPGWEGVDAHGIDDAIIMGNIIKNTLTGIAIVTSNEVQDLTSNNVIITNNYYEQTITADSSRSTFGITVNVGTGSKNINVANNIINGAGKNAGSVDKGGLKLTGGEISVINNKVVSDNVGIQCYSYANTEIEYYHICDNIIDTTGTGIYASCNHAVNYAILFKNNTIKNAAVAYKGSPTAPASKDSYFYCTKNTEVNCATRSDNITTGLYINPAYGIASMGQYDKQGHIIYNLTPNANNYLYWICRTSGTGSTNAVIDEVKLT